MKKICFLLAYYLVCDVSWAANSDWTRGDQSNPFFKQIEVTNQNALAIKNLGQTISESLAVSDQLIEVSHHFGGPGCTEWFNQQISPIFELIKTRMATFTDQVQDFMNHFTPRSCPVDEITKLSASRKEILVLLQRAAAKVREKQKECHDPSYTETVSVTRSDRYNFPNPGAVREEIYYGRDGNLYHTDGRGGFYSSNGHYFEKNGNGWTDTTNGTFYAGGHGRPNEY